MPLPRLEPRAPDWCFDSNDQGQLSSCIWDGTPEEHEARRRAILDTL